MPKKKDSLTVKAAKRLKKRGGKVSLAKDLLLPSGVEGATSGGLKPSNKTLRESIARRMDAKKTAAQEKAQERAKLAELAKRRDKLQASRKKKPGLLHDFAKGKSRVPRPGSAVSLKLRGRKKK